AILIQRIMEALNIVRIKKGLPSIHFRIGVNSGTMLAGNMGAQSRMEYTVVGDAVNLASRLSSAAEGDEIIISEEMLNRGDLAKRIISEQHTTLRLRGKKEPVATYRITGIGEKEQKHIAKALAGILKMEPQLVHKA
ncbi:MAG: adenylate/guanylate cyclase domain-containing protein, partial [Gammaproteobacteria bacterium]|nr:adenylate/guanylate cyclase domain-containing protein [Gammaproteobacteria bacterium]